MITFYTLSTRLMDLNKVMIIGRATTNLQVKTIESTWTSVANFVIATNRKYKSREWTLLEEAEYHRCVAYGKWADVLGEHLNKGKRVYIEGRLRTRKWADANGIERHSTEIIVDNFIFLDSRSHQEENITSTTQEVTATTQTTKDVLDEEIPF
jgi:single-strand DNA-binding protein